MSKSVIEAPGAGKPAGPYSQAIEAGGWIFVCGEKGVDPATGNIADGGIKAETAQALKNIETILNSAGSSLDDVVRCVVYMRHIDEFAAMNEVYADFFQTRPPARTTVGVAELPLGLRVMIEATAYKG
ncbi:MAG: Rid family detoxifying hydrolase [Pseudomonadota bacterium]